MYNIDSSQKRTIELKVNGRKIKCEANSHASLIELLRNELGLTGSKEGCGVGECGTCTIIMNGEAVRACLILAFEADGAEIVTIEGISEGKTLHPIQKRFIENDAIQCGFCTPGFVIAAISLFEKNKNPTKKDVEEIMGGHLCRCTGYHSIFKAIIGEENK